MNDDCLSEAELTSIVVGEAEKDAPCSQCKGMSPQKLNRSCYKELIF